MHDTVLGGCQLQLGVALVKLPKIIFAQTPFNFSGCPWLYVEKIDPHWVRQQEFCIFVIDWTSETHLTHYLTGKTMGF
jgi:hypothetical protein